MEAKAFLRAANEQMELPAEHCIVNAETDPERGWVYYEDDIPDRYGYGFRKLTRAVLSETDKPPVSYSRDGIKTEHIWTLFLVHDDGIDVQYGVKNGDGLSEGQAECVGFYTEEEAPDPEEYPLSRLTDAVQRAGDALENRVGWVTVSTPQERSGDIETAADLIEKTNHRAEFKASY